MRGLSGGSGVEAEPRPGGRRVRPALGAAAGLACGLALACPEPARAPAPPEHLLASEAGKVVWRAIEAHGGWQPWLSARSAEYDWERPGAGPQDPPRRARVRLDPHGGRVRIDEEGTGWVQAWDGGEAWAEPADAPSEMPARFLTRTEHYWFALPWKLADTGASLELLPDEERDGERYRRVRVTYAPGVGDTPQDWYIYYFNADTGLLKKAVFTVTFFGSDPEQGGFAPVYGEWSDYVQADGLKVASRRRFALWNEGSPSAFEHEDRLLNLRVSRQPLPDAVFQRGSS